METKNQTPKIYLKDLFFSVLYQWKRLLILALLAAVALGGFQFVQGMGTLNDPQQIADLEAQNQIQLDRYEAESAALSVQAANLLAVIQNQQAYLDTAPLMKMDPYHHYEATLVLFVDTGYQVQPQLSVQNPDLSATVIAAYHKHLLSSDSLDQMSQQLQVDALYLSELITLETAAAAADAAAVQQPSNLLIIHAKATTAADAEQMLQVIIQQIESSQQNIADSICTHTLNTVEQTVTPKVDAAVATAQQTARTQQDKLIKDLSTVRDKQANLAQPEIQGTDSATVIKQAIKLAVIGFALVIILGAVILIFAHIGSDKVYSHRTLADRTAVKLLGILSAKKVFGVRKLEGRRCTDEEDLQVLAANIRNRCQDTGKLLITGSAEEAQRKALIAVLAEKLPNVQILNGRDILRSADAMEQLVSCDAVILAEQCHVSTYEQVNRRCEQIEDHNKKLLGCVLYGG